MKLRSILALTVLVCFATFCAADTVTGTLRFDGNPNNYFDPANGFVPGGSDNSGSNTINTPGTFSFSDGLNADSAQFTGTQLIVTDNCLIGAGQCGGDFNWTMTFSDPSITGISLNADSFVPGTNFSLNNGLITITWGGGAGVGQAVYDLQETPEPGSLALLGSGLIGLGGAIRRKLVR